MVLFVGIAVHFSGAELDSFHLILVRAFETNRLLTNLFAFKTFPYGLVVLTFRFDFDRLRWSI